MMIFLVTTCIEQKGSKLQVLFPPKPVVQKFPILLPCAKMCPWTASVGGRLEAGFTATPALLCVAPGHTFLQSDSSANDNFKSLILEKSEKSSLVLKSILNFTVYFWTPCTTRQGNNLSMEKSFTLQLPVQTSLMWHHIQRCEDSCQENTPREVTWQHNIVCDKKDNCWRFF